MGNGPVGGKAPEVINADYIIQPCRTVNAANPPAEAIVLHGLVIVQRISPELSVSAEVVRRDTGDLCGKAVGIQLEHSPLRPDVGGVHGNINGNVPDDADAKAVDIGFQSVPLAEKQKLYISVKFDFLLCLSPAALQRLWAAQTGCPPTTAATASFQTAPSAP